jgi:hypothetical protein
MGAHALSDGVMTLSTGALVEPARSACDTPTHTPPVRKPGAVLEGIALIEVIAVHHALVISVARSNGQAWLAARLWGD